MPDSTNTPKADDGIENLPEAQRKETEDIIAEIEKEAQPPEPEEKEKPEEKKPKEDPKPEDKQKAADEKKPDEKSRKQVKLIPAWVHETAKSQWEAREKELQDELKKAAEGSKHDQEKGEKADDTIDADLRKKTDAIAHKYGTDPDEEYDRAVTSRGTVQPAPKVEIPKEIAEGIAKINKYEQDQQTLTEEAHFTSDFDSKILPLIKAEYGDDVPESTIEDIKDNVKAKAYSEEYAKVPLSTIYKGEDQFRGIIPKKQSGSEKSRGGYRAAAEPFKGDELDLTKEQSDEMVANMTPEQFDTYSNNMQKKEKTR